MQIYSLHTRGYRLTVSALATLVVLSLGAILLGCPRTITIPPTTQIGTPPYVEMGIIADGGTTSITLEPGSSCDVMFSNYETPVVLRALGTDEEEGVRRITLEGEVAFRCGAGDCISAHTDPIVEERASTAGVGEQGRVSRFVLRRVRFPELDQQCQAQSGCGFLADQSVTVSMFAESENFHGQTASTPTFQCLLQHVGPPPPSP